LNASAKARNVGMTAELHIALYRLRIFAPG